MDSSSGEVLEMHQSIDSAMSACSYLGTDKPNIYLSRKSDRLLIELSYSQIKSIVDLSIIK